MFIRPLKELGVHSLHTAQIARSSGANGAIWADALVLVRALFYSPVLLKLGGS
jgi:hypothetical protein